MSPDDAAEVFAAQRPRLFGIAYRMLGSAAEADDVLQEAHLRWQAAQHEAIAAPGGWLATVVTRLCLDQLKSARARREAYVGPWLPEPLPTGGAAEPVDVESISLAFLVLLESLSPLERAAFVLREVFDHSFAEIAEALGRDEAACRQLAHRARAHVQARKPRFARSREQHARLLAAFLGACAQGDLAGLTAMLAGDVVAWSDGGGRVKAARNLVEGSDRVARLFLGLAKRSGGGSQVTIEEINGWPAAVVRVGGGAVYGVLCLETDGETIYSLQLVNNPDKLSRV